MIDLWLFVPGLAALGLFVVLPGLCIWAAHLHREAKQYEQLAELLEAADLAEVA